MNMDFNSLDSIKQAGFVGFKSKEDLFLDCSEIPKVKGIYLILYAGPINPSYLEFGTGGHFKGKNPNVPVSFLESNWVANTKVVYIGKAGGDTSNATLLSRLKQYFGFGQGKPIGHWGGRLIWQLENSRQLIVCWKPLPDEEPRRIEADLIRDFASQYGSRPFANLAD